MDAATSERGRTCPDHDQLMGQHLTHFVALVALVVAACGASPGASSSEDATCSVARLDGVQDPADLFDPSEARCVIITWDTAMEGAGAGPNGGQETPPALLAAATEGGFAAPCETMVDAQRPSPERAWFISRFGALDPEASYWAVTYFARTPLPDGVAPGCANVTYRP